MERDDIIEYSLDAHHSEEAGKKIRRKIVFVTLLLTAITAIEVFVGAYWRSWTNTPEETFEYVKLGFILLTILKAGYIVMVFMHLGDERRNLRALILIPYGLFILYLIYMAMWESNYVEYMLDYFR